MKMESSKNRRRRARKAQAARRRKRRNRRLFLIFSVVCILAVILLLAVSLKKRSSGGGGANVYQTVSADDSIGQEERILTLTEQQMHTGDLILVSKDYAYDFDANADTVSLVTILDKQSIPYQVGKPEFQVAERIMPSLDRMVDDCNKAVGSNMTGVASAFRSLEYQQNVWKEMEEQYGTDYAKEYVAVPGFSEHHTGLAVDMSIYAEDGIEGTFSESENAVWMNKNAFHYGFVRRYAEDKTEITGINNEAWHFRYVGMPHAAFMSKKNLCLEEYIDFLRENASPERPLEVDCDDGNYDIFFTLERAVIEPEGEYTVSGNNVDGYIITVKRS